MLKMENMDFTYYCLTGTFVGATLYQKANHKDTKIRESTKERIGYVGRLLSGPSHHLLPWKEAAATLPRKGAQ